MFLSSLSSTFRTTQRSKNVGNMRIFFFVSLWRFQWFYTILYRRTVYVTFTFNEINRKNCCLSGNHTGFYCLFNFIFEFLLFLLQQLFIVNSFAAVQCTQWFEISGDHQPQPTHTESSFSSSLCLFGSKLFWARWNI